MPSLWGSTGWVQDEVEIPHPSHPGSALCVVEARRLARFHDDGSFGEWDGPPEVQVQEYADPANKAAGIRSTWRALTPYHCTFLSSALCDALDGVDKDNARDQAHQAAIDAKREAREAAHANDD